MQHKCKKKLFILETDLPLGFDKSFNMKLVSSFSNVFFCFSFNGSNLREKKGKLSKNGSAGERIPSAFNT